MVKKSRLLVGSVCWTTCLLVCWVVVCLFIAFWPKITNSAELTVTVKWAVNDMPATGGFIMYHKAPGQTEWAEVWNVDGPLLREWAGALPMEEGVNAYAMTSFSGDVTSEFSTEYTYEWLAPQTPGGLPVPTVLIQFGMPQ